MKYCIIAFSVSVLFSPSLVTAEKIALDVGRGIHNMRGTDAAFLRYAVDFDTSIFPGQNFYEGSVGVWDGKGRNRGGGFSFGTRGRFEGFHIDGSVGIAYFEDKTVLSGTHQQFCARLGFGATYGRADIGLYLTHYSNAKPLFGWDGPNAGYDFITLQLAYPVK